jgi:hypothetical protein
MGYGGGGRGGGGGGGVGPVISIAPTTGIPFGHVPAYLPGSSSLVEELETRVLIVLRDGRHLVGVSTSSSRKEGGTEATTAWALLRITLDTLTISCSHFYGVPSPPDAPIV